MHMHMFKVLPGPVNRFMLTFRFPVTRSSSVNKRRNIEGPSASPRPRGHLLYPDRDVARVPRRRALLAAGLVRGRGGCRRVANRAGVPARQGAVAGHAADGMPAAGAGRAEDRGL